MPGPGGWPPWATTIIIPVIYRAFFGPVKFSALWGSLAGVVCAGFVLARVFGTGSAVL